MICSVSGAIMIFPKHPQNNGHWNSSCNAEVFGAAIGRSCRALLLFWAGLGKNGTNHGVVGTLGQNRAAHRVATIETVL